MPPVTVEDHFSDNEVADADDNESIATATDFDDGDNLDDDADYHPGDDSDSSSSSGDESDMDKEFPEPHEDEEIQEDPEYRKQHEQTERLLQQLSDDPEGLDQKVVDILRYMEKKGINIAIFLDALSWGTTECASNRAIAQSRKLGILSRWYEPPRPVGSTNSRPHGARNAIRDVSQKCVSDLVEKELVSLYKLVYNKNKMMKETEVTRVHIKRLTKDMRNAAPILWKLLETIARTKLQEKRNIKKNPDNIITIVLSMLLYSQNQHCNLLQKIFGMYFKFRQLAIRGFDVLHTLGITMSSSWATKNLNMISDDNMNTIADYMQQLLVVLTYDNVNIHRKAFEQRIDHQTHFDSGAAGTAFVSTKRYPLSPEQVAATKAARAEGIEKPLGCLDIFELEEVASKALHPHIVNQILRTLLESPEFDFKTYPHKDSHLFEAPIPLHPLPIRRPGDIPLQFLLRTVHQEETSYEGNDKLIEEWLRQLKLTSPEERRKLGTERMIPLVGDQLTVDRLRGLYKFRAEDNCSIERIEHLLYLFGWFHLLMIFACSLHKQYYGSVGSRGLAHDFTLLNKKGISKTITKGPFHHHLDEAIHHRLDAHLRYSWMFTSGVSNLADLRQKTPAELVELAEWVYLEHASTLALDKITSQPEEEQDELRHQSVMWNRDSLHYVTLVRAVKTGDVGIMEAMLPHLLFRFVGGGNKKYSGEVIELLQMLHRELPLDVRDFVREECWLLNFQGKPDTHLPFDQAQEHNIKGIKGIDGGPHGGWGYLYKYTPAIRTIQSVNGHIEGDFGVLSRGKKHSSPSKEADIGKLMQSYQESKIYALNDSRKFKNDAPAGDVILSGALALQKNDFFKKWNEKRAFPRSTEESPEDEDSDNDD
ncbi:hypothetical protein SCHPADRAFT_946131 [Schizopora paradoxa]|uniref:DUF6589 domain-containing protein n=1 Tax=Schizopora paradoxa TaxID=27342 RepID=A0A0H2RA56_9AGAM|nr:hypothetical protein SCHPADRAFT_946131 [Schizopora paradoxa]